MQRSIVIFAGLTLLAVSPSAAGPDLEAELRFEAPTDTTMPAGWGGGPAGTIAFETETVHGGVGAARIVRVAGSAGTFSSLTKLVPVEFAGRTLTLRGYLRTHEVSGEAGLWLRLDGRAGPVGFASMPVEKRAVTGSTAWTEHQVELALDPKARELYFGVLLQGEGTVWVDDLAILVDGEPLGAAPAREMVATPLDTDTAFADGSGLAITELSAVQVDNVALLIRVWGFLKYHHPAIARGDRHWDYELFRALPAVLAAADRGAGRRAMAAWVKNVGIPEACDPCAQPPDQPHLRPPIDWLDNTELLGEALAAQLGTIHQRRYAGTESFWVAQVPGVGNPVLDNELAYPRQQPPDAGYRLLALARLWNIVEYWFPYRDQLDDDWPSVLHESLPRLAAADDWDAYRLELLALIARIGDTHANLASAFDVRPPRGDCRWPVTVRFVEGRATVTALLDVEGADGTVNAQARLAVGDVIAAIEERGIDELVAEWSPYYAASNQPTRLRDIARFLPRGPCGPSRLDVVRRGERASVTVVRRAGVAPWPRSHDRPGESFQRLSDDIAYLKLSSVRAADIDRYLEQAAGSRGMVIDIRGYPSEFVVFALGNRLVEARTPFVRFTAGDLANPGTFVWTETLVLSPSEPGYPGRVAILVDETTISQAEYTAMALRAGPRAVVVGSTTAGADGNISRIPLPGGLTTVISGIGVFYADGTPTQRVGIVPDIVAAPTIAGVRAGRDEVLEAAIRHLLGPDFDEAAVRALARR